MNSKATRAARTARKALLTTAEDGTELKMDEKIQYKVLAEPDLCSFPDEFPPELVKQLQERLDRGDVWAWAEVTVCACYKGYTGRAYLGGSSYENTKDFIENSCYYSELCLAAKKDLMENLKLAIEKGVQAEQIQKELTGSEN